MAFLVDLTGRSFGLLTVIAYAGANKRRANMWECKCKCGAVKSVSGGNLVAGTTSSCGCAKKARLVARNTTHGLSNSRVYQTYSSMRNRCLNPKDSGYPRYGGRGITICLEWLTFDGFWADVKDDYRDNLTIERKDIDVGYCKDNVIWVPNKQQARNKSTSAMYRHNGVKRCLAEICEIEGLPYGRIWARLNACGMSLSDALSQDKVNVGKRRKLHSDLQ